MNQNRFKAVHGQEIIAINKGDQIHKKISKFHDIIKKYNNIQIFIPVYIDVLATGLILS